MVIMFYPESRIIVKLLLPFLLILYINACANNPSSTATPVSVTRLDNNVDLNNSALVKQQLLRQYNEWKGTQYKIGGLNRQGVDCSGFVYVTFRSKLGLEIPRTTELQLKVGADIAKADLRSGDLIFFKTGLFTRHIGVYMGKGQFIHASSSRGVTLSSLNNKYWQSKYWLSKRLDS